GGMPSWLPRSMMLALWLVTAFGVALWLFLKLQNLIMLLLISLFLALALEPAVNWLHRRRWPRGPATGAVMLVVLALSVLFLSMLGSMLIGQILAFVSEIPAMVWALLNWVNTTFGTSYSPTTLLNEDRKSTRLNSSHVSIS